MLKQDPADPNNLKETVVNILVLNYNNYCVKFSSQVNFNIKEDLSFILNERSSFLLPFRRGYIAKGEVYQRYIHQSVEMKRLKALIPSSVHLYTPASSSTLQNTFPTSCSKICSIFSSVTLSYSDRKASVQSACFAI